MTNYLSREFVELGAKSGYAIFSAAALVAKNEACSGPMFDLTTLLSKCRLASYHLRTVNPLSIFASYPTKNCQGGAAKMTLTFSWGIARFTPRR
jgi:hypothetical protein